MKKELKLWIQTAQSLTPKSPLELEPIYEELNADDTLTPEEKQIVVETLERVLGSFDGHEDNKNKKELAEKFVDYDELGLNYDNYDPLFANFKVGGKSWQELNPDRLPYQHWLIKEGLPRFWVQSRPDLQYPLLTAISFINSAAIPNRTVQAMKEAPMPLVVFSGQPGTGKTEGARFPMLCYHPRRTVLLKADSTGTALRNSIHETCYHPYQERLVPSCVLIDNVESSSFDRWDSYRVLLLSVLKSQSYCSISDKGHNITYYAHCLKLFTTIESVKAFNLRQSEFKRRQVFLFTEKNDRVKSIANYSFSDIPDYYKWVWRAEEVKRTWFPILAEFLRMDDNATACPSDKWAQSLLIMATGVYIGLWGSVKEAGDFFAEYWRWVSEVEDKTKHELELLVGDYLNDYDLQAEVVLGRATRRVGDKCEKEFLQDDLLNYVRKRSSKPTTEQVRFIEGYLDLKGWKKETRTKIGNQGGEIVWKKTYIKTVNYAD